MATRIANTAASILNQTVLTAAQAQNITGAKSFNRAPSAPFIVQAGSAKVSNLDADLLDGQNGSYYNDAANLTGTTLPASIVASSLAGVGTITSGVWNAGTITATAPLTINGISTANILTGGGNSQQSLLVQNTTSGTAAYSSFGLSAGSVNGALSTYSQGFTTSGTAIQASILIYGDGAGGVSIQANGAAGAIRFYSGGATERARIHASGGISLFGTTDPGAAVLRIDGKQLLFGTLSNLLDLFPTADAIAGLYVNFRSSGGGTIGSITELAGFASIAFNTSSDQRLKTDRGIAANLTGLRSLIVHDFAWLDGTLDRGVFAQEAHRVFPRAITPGTDERLPSGDLASPWQANYQAFVPDLIVGWQQHDNRIATLEAQIAQLLAKG